MSQNPKKRNSPTSKIGTPAVSEPPVTELALPVEASPVVNPINKILLDFLQDIQSIQKTHALVLPHVLKWLSDQQKANVTKLAKYVSDVEGEKDFFLDRSAHEAADMMKALKALDGLGGMRIPDTLQRSLFTQLFAEYDSFVGALLKVLYKSKADLLKGISRQITFADLLSYENLNAVKLDMLDKEIETFRRDSYVEQFTTLENKFGMKLRGFPEWGEFIELSQRRNLIVHNGGLVSEQYLIVCDREKFVFDQRPAIGDSLKPDGRYFSRAIVVISKVAFMLCHTLWRKLFPKDKKEAQLAANDVLYELLRDGRWKSAYEISTFCLTEPMKDGIEEIDLRLRTINCAIATKFSGNQQGCLDCLKTLDWTASYRDFRLALFVLQDDFAKAKEMMKFIGKSGELISEISYHQWPLFFKFRESPEFLQTYEEIYGVSFITAVVRENAEVTQANKLEIIKESEMTDFSPKRNNAKATPIKVPAPSAKNAAKPSKNVKTAGVVRAVKTVKAIKAIRH